MKKLIAILIVILSFSATRLYAQCHTYDTIQVITQNVGGDIDSITLSSTFYVVLANDTMPFNIQVKAQRTVIYKISSSLTGIEMIGYADQYVYSWVQKYYRAW